MHLYPPVQVLEVLMFAKTRSLVVLLIAFAVAMQATPLFAADSHPFAPQLSFSGLSGKKVSLDQFRGSVVLLNLWTTSCSICLSEIPTLSELQDRYARQGLQVIAVALDEQPESVRKFTETRHFNYTVATANSAVEEQFGVDGFPVTFVIGRDGRMYSQHSGAIRAESLESEITQLLGADPLKLVETFRPSEDAVPVTLPTAAELESEVPGVDLSQLNTAQVAELKEHLDAATCPCGCNRSILKCRMNHSSCKESKQLAREATQKLRSPMI